MPNTRAFCDSESDGSALVLPSVEVRDSLGALAVQVLATRENLANMDYCEMVSKLYAIVCDLHSAYDQERVRSMPL